MLKILSSIFLLCYFSLTAPLSFASPPPDAFGQLKRVHDASISPDGNMVAVIENIEGKYTVRVMNLDGETLHDGFVGLDHSVRPSWIKWVNNERFLLGVRLNTLIQKVPAPFTYIFTQSISDKQSRILVESRGIKRQFNANVLNYLMDDPVYILMSVMNLNSGAPEVRKVNVKTGKFIKVEPGNKNVGRWYADLDGNVRIGVGVKRENMAEKDPDYEMQIRLAGGEAWQDQSEFPGLNGKTAIFGFSENPNEVLIGQYKGKDTLGLYGYDLAEKKISRKLFHHDIYDVEGPVFSGDGKRLIGVRFQSEIQETVFFESSGSETKGRVPEGTQKHYRFLDQSEDGQRILYEVSAANDSGFIGLYNANTKTMTKFGDQYPDVSGHALGTIIPVSYEARDGVEIPAYITLSQGLSSEADIQNQPFIILPHGGPYARDSNQYDYLAQFFAFKGFAVLQMNFRGSTGYGKIFEESGRENWELMLDDVEDGAKWLRDSGLSKPDQTCIAGWSFGGYAALMGAARNDGLYTCAISIAGVTDLNDLANDELKYVGGKQTRNSILEGFDGRKDMRLKSPFANADKIEIPVFLAHGTYDQRVHFDQFTRMKRQLKKAGVSYTAKDYDKEDHFMSIEENRKDMFRAIDTFLDKSVGKVK